MIFIRDSGLCVLLAEEQRHSATMLELSGFEKSHFFVNTKLNVFINIYVVSL